MNECLRKVQAAGSPALFLDYDGTLVALQPSPALAVLRPAKKKILTELARKIPLAFVSGRSLAELRGLVAIDNADYIGNHGLEISCRGKDWVHRQARNIEPELKDFLKLLVEKTEGFDGVLVEDKGLTGSVHYRRTPAGQRRALMELVLGEMAAHSRTLRPVPGKMVLDVRPQVQWDKGRAIFKYIACLDIRRRVSKIYIGDDRTDEDAFMILGPRDIGIAVGNRRRSAAEFRRRDVQSVWNFLVSLNAWL
jgi:trehalose-phosphatase